MALSSCPKCWETPCVCGYGYRDWSYMHRVQLAEAVLGAPLTDEMKALTPTKHPKHNEE